MSLKARVEAVLFLTDKPVVAAAVAKLVNEDVQLVRQAILELIHDYEEKQCALEIADDDDGYMMQVRDEYANLANDLAPIDLPVSVVRTLSAIAIKQPVMQSDIVRIRGAGAYEHIKELLEKELIAKKEEGRSPLLSTTKKFQQYFRLSQDAKALRYQLKEQVKEQDQPEAQLPEDQQLQIQDVQLSSGEGAATAQEIQFEQEPVINEPAQDLQPGFEHEAAPQVGTEEEQSLESVQASDAEQEQNIESVQDIDMEPVLTETIAESDINFRRESSPKPDVIVDDDAASSVREPHRGATGHDDVTNNDGVPVIENNFKPIQVIS